MLATDDIAVNKRRIGKYIKEYRETSSYSSNM